jgi:hypothetical protein
MSVLTITNQTNFTLTSGVPRQNQAVDRGPRRSFPGQIIEWRIQQPSSVEVSNSSRIRLIDFELLRQTVRDSAHLPQGWDSGNAGPMSDVAIQNAIRLLDLLESARISPSRVIPTCDDSILIRYQIHDDTIEWEFFSEGDNVRVQIEPSGEESYLEIPADQISRQYI